MTTEPEIESTRPSLPLLLRIVSLLILVEGVLGLLFFIATGFFQLNDENFAGTSASLSQSSNFYSFYIVLQLVLYSGFILSAYFLLSLKKTGYYLFIINYLIFAGFSLFFNDVFSWTISIVGLVFLAVLTYFLKKMI